MPSPTRILIALVLASAPTFAAAADITLSVDAREAPRKILHASETLPVAPGPLSLVYPKWIPGEHGPTGPIIDMAGLRLSAGGKKLAWKRDLGEMYRFDTEIPAGATSLLVEFDFLVPGEEEGFSSGSSTTAQLGVISWNQVLLYPLGADPAKLMILPDVRVPDGWQLASALVRSKRRAPGIAFEPVSLEQLIDSPVLAGAYFRSLDLSPGQTPAHRLNIAADSEAALALLPAQLESYRRLVVETGALFGARHYEHYDFLYALSDHVAHFGLEHHQSSDNRLDERTLIEEDLRRESADLLPHEMVHSWNGKHRRPANLATPDYLMPMRSDLLWVYEGLTQYWGKVLTARTGLWTPDEFRADLALLAANLDHQPGREWRPLQDTADEAQLLYYGRTDWSALRRGVDFYDEGVLIWLEADVTIRTLSGGKQSLDDFARRFHGGQSSGPVVRPYTSEDVVRALNEIAPYDWSKFFGDRLTSTAARAPLGGIEAGGWKLGYRDKRSEMQKSSETNRKRVNLRDSIGIWLEEDGGIADVVPGMAAAKAGVGPGMRLIAVNERKYSEDVIREAIRAGKGSRAPLSLLLESNGYFKTYAVDYHEGERYPVLERDPAKPDLLGEIIKAVAPSQPSGSTPTPGR